MQLLDDLLPIRKLFGLLAVILLSPAEPRALQQDLSACGPMDEKLAIVRHKPELPLPQPSADKAMIYVYCTGHFRCGGYGVQSRIGLNGRWVAAISKNTYARIEVDPGILRFCQKPYGARPSAGNFLFVTAEAGKTYYLLAASGHLDEVSEQEASAQLKKCRLATFKRK